MTDYSAKNAENLRSCPSFDEVQHGGVNNYVMHSNGVILRPRLMGTADNRRTELLRTYPVKNLMLGGTLLRCCVNIMSRVQKNEINHDIAIKWSQNTKELHKGHELSLFLPSTLNSRRANCSEGLILAYSRYFTMIDSVTQCRFLNHVRPV